MYLAEKELRGQFDALCKTTRYMLERREQLQAFLGDIHSLCILGCGSSYSTAKSSALQFSQKTGIPSYAVAAGDLLVNIDSYENIIKNATLVLLSRSGSTSELLLAVRQCRKRHPGIRVLSVCAVENAPASKLADTNIEIPWAFDESVCQTRTVSNLYASMLLLAAMKAGDEALISDIVAVKEKSVPFCGAVEKVLGELAEGSWKNAVVLADSGMAGLAEEGALAFKEICRTPSNFYHVLDVRHGPIVTIGNNALAIILISRGDERLQTELVNDIQKRVHTTLVLTCKPLSKPIEGVSEICLPESVHDDVSAIFMLYCIQLLCLKHALFKGLNPDTPEGLDPWIHLNEKPD